MLKFFRNIRQKLITENRFSKYMVYAVGEIFLVVIGILIALQINNWNEAHKTEQKQRDYLALIKNEMSSNLTALRQEKEDAKGFVKSLAQMIQLKSRATDEFNEKDLSSVWGGAFSRSMRFQYENGTLTELISSGGLKDITNDSIRHILASIDSKVQRIAEQEQEVNNYIQDGNNYLQQHGNVRVVIDNNGGNDWWEIDTLKTPKSNQFLLDSQEFENIVVFSIGTGKNLYQSYYSRLEQDIITLIRLIEKELGDSN